MPEDSSLGSVLSDSGGTSDPGPGVEVTLVEVTLVEVTPPEDRIPGMIWPLVIILSTAGVEIASLLPIAPALRTPVVLWFCAVCPGMAWVRLLRMGHPLAEAVMAVALSLALCGITAAAFLYAGRWSPTGTMIVLEALTLAAVLLDLRSAAAAQVRGGASSPDRPGPAGQPPVSRGSRP